MLYDYLWLSNQASYEAIRHHYKMITKSIHPDRNQNNGQLELSNEMFRKVEHAYQILSHPISRLIYDRFGEEGLQLYESNKEEFDKLDPKAESCLSEALKLLEKCRTSSLNSKTLFKMERQSIDLKADMSMYFLKNSVNKDRYLYPHTRFVHLGYNMRMNLASNTSCEFEMPQNNSSYAPKLKFIHQNTCSLFGKDLDYSAMFDLLSPSNMTFEVTKKHNELQY